MQSGDCLLFMGTRNKAGYGHVQISFDYKARRYNILAHRLAWVIAHGMEVPEGKIICHRCNVPNCCNPKHLYAGTPLTNARDMVRAGRSCKGKRGSLYGVLGTAHPRSRYDQELKDQLIDVMRQGLNFQQLARQTGITAQTLARWWGEYLMSQGRGSKRLRLRISRRVNIRSDE